MSKNTETPQWAISSNEEDYGHEIFDSREDAITEGMDLFDGEPFYVGQLEEPIQPEALFDASDWLETVSCQADYMGEHAEDWDVSTREQQEELNAEVQAVMAAWLDRHKLRPTFWNVGHAEKIAPDTTA